MSPREVSVLDMMEARDRRAGLQRRMTAALLHILSAEADTNMIARSSLETAEEIRGAIRELLQETPFPDRETLEALDLRFRELNLSPGGSADLLAICYLLHFMKTETLV